jgi:hypothetical protein
LIRGSNKSLALTLLRVQRWGACGLLVVLPTRDLALIDEENIAAGLPRGQSSRKSASPPSNDEQLGRFLRQVGQADRRCAPARDIRLCEEATARHQEAWLSWGQAGSNLLRWLVLSLNPH